MRLVAQNSARSRNAGWPGKLLLRLIFRWARDACLAIKFNFDFNFDVNCDPAAARLMHSAVRAGKLCHRLVDETPDADVHHQP